MTEALATDRPRRVNVRLKSLVGTRDHAEVVVQYVGDVAGRVVVIDCSRVLATSRDFFDAVVVRLFEEGVESIEFLVIADEYWGWVLDSATAIGARDRVLRGSFGRLRLT